MHCWKCRLAEETVCAYVGRKFSHYLAVHRLWVNCSRPYKIPLKANTLDRNMSFSLYTVQIHGLLPQNHIFQKSHTWRPWSALKYATSLIMITEQLHIRERKKKTKPNNILSGQLVKISITLILAKFTPCAKTRDLFHWAHYQGL